MPRDSQHSAQSTSKLADAQEACVSARVASDHLQASDQGTAAIDSLVDTDSSALCSTGSYAAMQHQPMRLARRRSYVACFRSQPEEDDERLESLQWKAARQLK
jgi:hypothetical protein